MKSRVPQASFLLVLVSVAAMAAAASAQGSGNAPEKLWEFNPPLSGTFTDVGIDSSGRLAAATMTDGSALSTDDNELFAWDLSSSSSTPTLRADPTPGLLASEGLNVVAVAPQGGLVAVGSQTGQGDASVFIYEPLRGTEFARPGYRDDNAPTGVLDDLTFSADGSLLLSQHRDRLVLLERTSGTDFDEPNDPDARWAPPEGETMVAVTATPDLSLVVVATEDEALTGANENRLHVLEVQSDAQFRSAGPPHLRPRESASAFNALAISDNGNFLVAGTQDRVVLYYQLGEDEDGDIEFSQPWSQSTPSAVSAVAISDDGLRFAAGFANGGLLVYEQTELDDGPLAQRSIRSVFTTGTAVDQLAFARQGTSLYAAAGTLYHFDAIQFDTDEDLTALWTINGVERFAVSDDGDRLLAAQGEIVRAFQQRYVADIAVGNFGQAGPRETLSVPVTVTNAGSAFDEYTLDTTGVPPGWSVELSRVMLNLEPGASQRVLVNLTPDATQAPGEVTITFTVESRFSPSEALAGSRDIAITVREVKAASIELDDTIIDVVRNAPATITGTLTNAGNVGGALLVEVRQQGSWAATIQGSPGNSREIELDPGEEVELTVNLDVPGGAQQGSVNEVTIRARPVDGGAQDEDTVRLVVEPDYGSAVAGPTETRSVTAGETVTFQVTVGNTGNTLDTFILKAHSNSTNPNLFWEARLATLTLELDGGHERSVTVTVTVPRGASPGDAADITIVSRSEGSGIQEGSATFRLQVGDEEEDGSPLGAWVALVAVAAAATLVRRRQP